MALKSQCVSIDPLTRERWARKARMRLHCLLNGLCAPACTHCLHALPAASRLLLGRPQRSERFLARALRTHRTHRIAPSGSLE